MGTKVAIVGILSLVVAAMAAPLAASGGVTHKAATPNPNLIQSVHPICQATVYKQSCERSLASATTAEPKELIKLAITAAVNQITAAMKTTAVLGKVYKSSPRTSQAFQACNEALDTSKFHLQQTFDTLNTLKWSQAGKYAVEIQTAVSASYSYFVMCSDSFEDTSRTTIEGKKRVEKVIQSSKELTDNVLVMVNQIKAS